MLLLRIVVLWLLSASSYALLVSGTQSDDVDRRLQILEHDNALMRQQIANNEAKTQQLENDHQAQINALKGKVGILEKKDRNIAFFAYLKNSISDVPVGLTITFEEVVTNEGSDYDPLHGIFRAPINGTYHFSLVASSEIKNSLHALHLNIMRNDVSVSYLYLDFSGSDTETAWEQQSTTALLHLSTDDRVWVQSTATAGHPTLDGHIGINSMHTHFSGFLVTAD